eukprot:TRINITY_DN342_c0_g2_i1.p1 TRINITY_DN342_c0_g2~~TRINITY_DN342_c0_g2_i1.p1  ORF type:complete len:542 (+),score=102.65 TRINITY_DN342_c0_g2_i1:169-1626(+)
MSWFLLLFLLLITYQMIIYIKYLFQRPPGPFPLPFFYNLFLMLKVRGTDGGSGWYRYWSHLAEKHGHCFGFAIPFDTPIVLVTNPEDVEYILKTNIDNFQKGPQFRSAFQDLLGDGIFNMDHNDLWKVQRKTASHLFKNSNLKQMVGVFRKHGAEVIEVLEQHAESGEPIDLQDLYQKFTLDSICEIAFGQHLGSLKKQVPFADSFSEAVSLTESRLFSPFWKWLPRNWLPSEVSLKKNIDTINEFAYKIVEEKKKNVTEYDTDVLGRMINNQAGEVYSDDFLRDIIMNFTIAGRDTTAQTLTWSTYLLCQNNAAESKLLDEISAMGGSYPTFEALREMTYSRAVIDETLRLYPPVPGDPKYCVQDDVLPSGRKVYKGWRVAWSAYVMGRSGDYWDQPEQFVPERFLDFKTFNGGKEISAWTNLPFQAGPRICLGKEMAYLEVTTLLSMILPLYSFEPVQDHPVKLEPSATIASQNGVLVKVFKR